MPGANMYPDEWLALAIALTLPGVITWLAFWTLTELLGPPRPGDSPARGEDW